MNAPWLAVVAVLCNVLAQLAMKQAGQAQGHVNDLTGWLTPWLIAAIALYGASFLLTSRVFAVNPLSVASPIMAGATFVLIALASCLLLGEGFGLLKLAGIGLVLCGIALLSVA